MTLNMEKATIAFTNLEGNCYGSRRNMITYICGGCGAKIEVRHSCAALCCRCKVNMIEQTGGQEENEEVEVKRKRRKRRKNGRRK